MNRILVVSALLLVAAALPATALAGGGYHRHAPAHGYGPPPGRYCATHRAHHVHHVRPRPLRRAYRHGYRQGYRHGAWRRYGHGYHGYRPHRYRPYYGRPAVRFHYGGPGLSITYIDD